MSYHHWDEDEFVEDGNNWDWYIVSMSNWFNDEPIGETWPIFTTGYDEAMTIFEVLLKKAYTQ